MNSNEENLSDLVYLGRRIDNALKYIKENESDLIELFYQIVEIPFIEILQGELDLEKEDYIFDYIDTLMDDLEEQFNTIFENK
jgi:hypothetical protein